MVFGGKTYGVGFWIARVARGLGTGLVRIVGLGGVIWGLLRWGGVWWWSVAG